MVCINGSVLFNALGVNASTEVSYVYYNYDQEPIFIEYTNYGDGTVPAVAAEVSCIDSSIELFQQCQDWARVQYKHVQTDFMDLSDGYGMLDSEQVISYVMDVIKLVQNKAMHPKS